MTKTFTRSLLFLCLFLPFLSLIVLPATSQTPAAGSGFTLVLDGQNDFVHAGLGNRGVTNQVTVEAWVKTTSQDYQWVVGKYSNSQGEDGGYHLYIDKGRAAFNGRDGSGNYRASGMSATLVADNRWHHLAGVCQNGRWEIWVDGLLENSLNTGYANVDLATNLVPMTIGNYPMFNDNYYGGQVDEVRIWKTGRSQAEIRKFMCQKLTGQEANLVAYFNADKGINSSTVLEDLSTIKTNGQLQNGPGFAFSGAPLGNESRSFYQDDWTNGLLEIAGSSGQHTFQVFRPSVNTKGVHLYRVDSPPNTRNGIGNGSSPGYYYGVFTVGAPHPAAYTVNYKAEQTSTCYSLYARADNAQSSWALLPTVNAPTSVALNKPDEHYRSEYILSTAPQPVVNLGRDTTLCAGSSLQLAAGNPGMKYRWQDGAASATYSVVAAGTYWVEVENAVGCVVRDSIQVYFLTPPEVFLGNDTTLCEGQQLTLKKQQPGVRYLWQDGSSQASYTITKPGKYWLRASLDICSQTDTILVNYQRSPPVVFSGDTVLCRGDKLLLTAAVPGATYQWQNGSTASTFLVEQEGLYSVSVRQGPCTTNSTKRVLYEDCEPFIPNIITPNGDALNETFFIRNVDPSEWALEIYNRLGQRIYQVSRYGNDWNAKGLSGGVYYYKLSHSRLRRSYKGYIEVVR